MKDFYSDKGRQKQNQLFGDRIFSEKRAMQSPSKQERAALDTIPDEAIIAIKNFDSLNGSNQAPCLKGNELQVYVPIWSPHMQKTLLYALTSGTAYTVESGNIYIWYTPYNGLEGSGFFRLKRFEFLNDGRAIKYFLDGTEKLPNPL